LKDEKNMGLSLLNRANTLGRLGRTDQARSLISEASSIAKKPNAARNLTALFYLYEAQAALRELNWLEAKAGSEQGLQLAGDLLKNTATEAAYILCLAKTFSGAVAEGRRRCEEALTRADKTGNPSLKAESLLAFAQVLVHTGSLDGALKHSLEAQKIFSSLGKHDSEWIALQIAARASRRTNNAKAREYAAQAEQILAGLEQQWGPDNYQTYLARPDINVFRLQLQEFLAQNPKPH
jgi:hypothetical protein